MQRGMEAKEIKREARETETESEGRKVSEGVKFRGYQGRSKPMKSIARLMCTSRCTTPGLARQ